MRLYRLLPGRAPFCSSVPREGKPRVISFSLPPRPYAPVRAAPPAAMPAAMPAVAEISSESSSVPESSTEPTPSEAFKDSFFPSSMLTPQPEELGAISPVKRPHLWADVSDGLSVTDVGRFLRFKRDDLIRQLPEGLAGETPRDIFLMPSRTRDIGIMYRKPTHEIIHQLSQFEGMSHIPKRGWLLEGKRGTGKSSVLNSVVAWARSRNWLVLFEPIGSRFGKEISEIVRSNSGVYLQNDLSVQLLERFLQFNEGMLSEVSVDLKYYGKTGIDSSPIEMLERVYLPLIQKRVSSRSDLASIVSEMHSMRTSLTLPSLVDKLPHPPSLQALVEFGVHNPSYATQTVAELLIQLKVQSTFPVLIALDEWNEMFVVSDFVSARYDNTVFNGYIPSYHLALSRLLSRWDGHEFKRGVKLFATSWNKRNRRQFDPKILGVKAEEIKQVRNFTKHEFAHYCAYQGITGTSHRFPEDRLEYFYMLTQGNGFEARKMMATFY